MGSAEADFVLSDGNGWNDFSGSLKTQGIIEATDLASYKTFGEGCAGSFGIPALDAAPGSLPRVGQSSLEASGKRLGVMAGQGVCRDTCSVIVCGLG